MKAFSFHVFCIFLCAGMFFGNQPAKGASELRGPWNEYAVIGGEVVFPVTHALDGAVTYQWQVFTDGGNLFEDLADSAVFVGSQTAALRISDVQANLFGTFFVWRKR